MGIPRQAKDVYRYEIPPYMEETSDGDYVLYSDYEKLYEAYLTVERDRGFRLKRCTAYVDVVRDRDRLREGERAADKQIDSLQMKLTGQLAINQALLREIDGLRAELDQQPWPEDTVAKSP